MDTERPFKQLVAMKVTSRMEYEEVSQLLTQIGYKCPKTPTGGYPWMVLTDDLKTTPQLAYLSPLTTLHGYYVIEEFNPMLFEAIAAISHTSEFFPGEWVDLKGDLYKCAGMRKGDILLEGYGEKGKEHSFPSKSYRKATIHELVKYLAKQSPSDEIKPGDWVVATENAGGQFTKGNVYKVKAIQKYSIEIECDDRGSKDNGWGESYFRKATPEEISAHLAKKEGVKPEATMPPSGIMPRWRWLELRAIGLQEAISRYASIKNNCVIEWEDELSSICAELVLMGKIPKYTTDEASIELAKYLKVPFVKIEIV